MLKQMHLKNFTVFSDVKLDFSAQLNVIVGENGAGKTHLLKAAYSVMAASRDEGRKPTAETPTKSALQSLLATKLVNVFRPESLGRLARRRQGRERCDVSLLFADAELNIDFSFATNSKSEVAVGNVPRKWLTSSPVYLPTRELLTIFPNFVSIYESRFLEFEETWRDTCLLLGTPLQRGPKQHRIKELLQPLEKAMNGSIDLDSNGRFYLQHSSGRMEMPLVAEGLRKLGMLARLIASGVLLDRGYLFWDEPEANLNPRLVKEVASVIAALSRSGIQIFLATHSLFLLREIEILMQDHRHPDVAARFFGLQPSDNGIAVIQGPTLADIGDITALEESLAQSDRYLELED
ncbi:ATP-binding protein [Paracidovorax avenae]|uniref:AAA family ATPase n=1 Tax=Paracidovorax avenae TaxID=80867 RepID=UPI000D158650|nr:ATP-binding protein [Paracidovorax avenae]AVS71211.1 ATP-binding protein [Paracidovorax avenae]